MKLSAVSRTTALLLVAAGLSLAAGPASATVTWKADFETRNLSQFEGGINTTKGARQNIEFVTDPVQQGMVAGKFTMHEDDYSFGQQMRVQVNRNNARTAEGQDVYTSFYFRVDSDPNVRISMCFWETMGSFRNMMTWYLLAKPGGGTTMNFGTGNLGEGKHLFTGDIAVGQWHQVAFHVHWSTSPTAGHIVFWLDGQQVVDETTATKPDGNPLFFQAGIFRRTRSPLMDIIFFDNFVEADSQADIMIASPVPGAPDGGAPDGGAPDSAADGATGSGGSLGGPGGAAGGGGSAGSGGSIGSTGGSGGRSGSGGSSPPASVAGGGCAVAGDGSSFTLDGLGLLVGLAAIRLGRTRARSGRETSWWLLAV